MYSNTRDWTVEWGDCDAAGIVFFPRFWAAFDTSTSQLIEAAAGERSADIFRAHDIIGWPMVDMSARFLTPASFGDKVQIVTCVTRVGQSSIALDHLLSLAGKLCVEASEVRVWAGARADGAPGIESRPIPLALAARLAGTG